MQTKLIEILFSATGWMTSVQIAEKGKWRSAQHVGVELQLMEKAGRVVRRKSPTVKQGNGMPATEWRHVDKRFDGDHVPDATKMIKNEPVVKESSITEQPKVSNQVIRESRTTEEENLGQQVAHLTDQLAGEKSNLQKAEAELETAETFNVRWLDLARKYDCKSISELHEYITRLEESKVAEITAKQPIGFVVSAPKQPMRRFKNNGTAKAQALSFARQFGAGDVFAIYPAGKARRIIESKAEWKDPS